MLLTPRTAAGGPPTLSVILPAYNEATRLPPTLDASLAYLEAVVAPDRGWELIVVDDGSTDGTSDVVRRHGLGGGLRLLRAARNGGKGAALRAGAAAATGERLLLMDADGATPLSALPSLERALEEARCDVAVGSRAAVLRQRPPHRRLMGAVFAALASSCVRELDDTQCGFKLLTRRAAARTLPHLHVTGWAYDVELLYLAQALGLGVTSATVPWADVAGSKVRPATPAQMAVDVARVGLLYGAGVWRLPEEGEEGPASAPLDGGPEYVELVS